MSMSRLAAMAQVRRELGSQEDIQCVECGLRDVKLFPRKLAAGESPRYLFKLCLEGI